MKPGFGALHNAVGPKIHQKRQRRSVSAKLTKGPGAPPSRGPLCELGQMVGRCRLGQQDRQPLAEQTKIDQVEATHILSAAVGVAE